MKTEPPEYYEHSEGDDVRIKVESDQDLSSGDLDSVNTRREEGELYEDTLENPISPMSDDNDNLEIDLKEQESGADEEARYPIDQFNNDESFPIIPENLEAVATKPQKKTWHAPYSH